MKAERDRCLAAGMNDHVAKPIEPETLFETLARWVWARSVAEPAEGAASAAERRPGAVGAASAAERRPGAVGAASAAERRPGAEGAARRPGAEGVPDSLSALPGVDVDAALRRLSGNRGLLIRLLREFAESWRDAPARLRGADAGHVAHTLRGSAATLSMKDLVAAVEAFETALRDDADRAAARLPAVDAALATVLDGLDAALPPPPAPPPPSQDPVDEGAIPLMRRLDGLLRDSDFAATDCFDELRPLLGGADGVDALGCQIERLDFGGARRTLRAMAQGLTVSLSEVEQR
jgi:CheY-like chemotaxis protein